MILGHGDGPIPAKILIVGEAWGEQEEREQTPFVGQSGQELNRMLHEAGLMRSACYVTNLVNARPPNNYLGAWITKKKKDLTVYHSPLRDRWVLPIVLEGYNALLKEIDMVQPNVIVACGNYAMWALTGAYGIMKWRGSLLRINVTGQVVETIRQLTDQPTLLPKLIPTIHPAAVLREWSSRCLVVRDLKRVKEHYTSREYTLPEWNFRVRPSFETVVKIIQELTSRLNAGEEFWIDFDIETSRGHLSCAGISWSRLDALCIPFMTRSSITGYWIPDEEAEIVYLLYKLLTHKRALIRGQNLLYDCQYTYRHWHFIPNVKQDTMIAQHSCFAALPKGLGFLGSMYCQHYVFWKEDK